MDENDLLLPAFLASLQQVEIAKVFELQSDFFALCKDAFVIQALLPRQLDFRNFLFERHRHRRRNRVRVLVRLDHVADLTAAVREGQSIVRLLAELKRRRHHRKKCGHTVASDRVAEKLRQRAVSIVRLFAFLEIVDDRNQMKERLVDVGRFEELLARDFGVLDPL